MSIPNTITSFLKQNKVDYEVVKHQFSTRSYQSSKLAKVDPKKVAKAVLLKYDNEYLLAVVQANRSIDMRGIREEYGNHMKMAKESEMSQCFPDCELGAVPAIGSIYGFRTIVDNLLRFQPEIYFESGDHEDLIKISEQDYEKLVGDASYSKISKDWF